MGLGRHVSPSQLHLTLPLMVNMLSACVPHLEHAYDTEHCFVLWNVRITVLQTD